MASLVAALAGVIKDKGEIERWAHVPQQLLASSALVAPSPKLAQHVGG